METQADSFLPLPAAEFEILLALTDGERHGYAIMQGVAARTGGKMQLLPGSLYRTLARLLELGLIVLKTVKHGPGPEDERRRYYGLTELGWKVLEAEAARLEDQVKAARARKLIRNPKRV
ncbi:MAG: PadR family transcriptional regulator [Blastocatellia bacterium]